MIAHGFGPAVVRAGVVFLVLVVLARPGAARAEETVDERLRRLEAAVQVLQQSLAAKDQELAQLRQEVRQAHAAAPTPAEHAALAAAAGAPAAGDLASEWRRQLAALRLVDLSAVLNAAAGGSSEHGETLGTLQGGGHDPKRRGFSLQQLELSLAGAVDPFFKLESHLVFTEDGVELEEAYATTTALPAELQVRAGYFLTPFGRLNPSHPHSWDWLDQPVINTRLFGGDGMRGPGVTLSWLAPLPWYSELLVGAQQGEGEFMASFRGEGLHAHHGAEEEHAEGIGGRPVVERETHGLGDLVYLARWSNGFDLGDAVSGQWGLSSLFGANNAGADSDTWVYGTDLVLKYHPAGSARQRPLLTWQTELMGRRYEAEAVATDEGPVPAATLRDWGLYTQVLHNLDRDWSWGLRYEYATGAGDSVEESEPVDRLDDPYRNDRHRVAPLLVYHPSEFTRLRLQYNYDHTSHLDQHEAHGVWLGLEFLIGTHPAHKY
jgi:hypothetical protein